MPNTALRFLLPAGLLALLFSGQAPAQQTKASKSETPEEIPSVSLFDALRDGQVTAKAEGRGDGQMTLSVTNNSRRKLRIVLPPSLVVSGASGQFGGGGMGGMGGGGMGGGMGGGGMGGGMGGGGMGGMGGGGMGGGMGGGGMGGGGMGGGMGGGGSRGGGGTMPATMGMMMLGRLIMSLTGEKESWDASSLMMGMMGGMGGGGMGGMGGMGGGMGGGGMGGMGGGMRSLPPTEPQSALMQPGQTRNLPTRLVNLTGPDADMKVPVPAKGEMLEILDADNDPRYGPRLQAALKRLATDKAPETVSQLVLWHIGVGIDWKTLTQLSKRWANPSEIALAKQFVAQLDAAKGDLPSETGTLYYELTADEGHKALANEVAALLKDRSIIGLTTQSGVPTKPSGPALSSRIRITDSEVLVQVATTDPAAGWVSAGKFSLPLPKGQDVKAAAVLADGMAEGVLSRLVRVQLITAKVKGKETYKIRIDNVSPLVLNGLALAAQKVGEDKSPSILPGISLPPKKSYTVPVTGEVVERLGLKNGEKSNLRVLAADLSGL